MPLFPEEPNWQELHGHEEQRIDAELRDAVDRVVSKGSVLMYATEKLAIFYPGDLATLAEVKSQAVTLFLTSQKESIDVAEISRCLGEITSDLHFHVRLA